MWYIGYGWRNNPFSVKSTSEVIGLDREKKNVTDYVNSNDICLITGTPGSGKTSMLNWLKKNIGWFKKKVIYINAENLHDAYNLRRKVGTPWFRKRVILLDEAHNCDEQFIRDLKNLWDSNKIQSVVIAQIGESIEFYPESIKSRIGNRILRLTGMDSELAKELIELRTNKNHPFSEDVLQLVVDDARGNPRKILENCELICIGLQKKKKVDLESAKSVLIQKKADRLMDVAHLDEPNALPDNLMPIDKKKLSKFSPMQRQIVCLLFDGNRTAKQVAEILNTSEGSVGKQLSTLIDQRTVAIHNHRRPKVYGLASEFKEDLK